jgi:hypothetical protein
MTLFTSHLLDWSVFFGITDNLLVLVYTVQMYIFIPMLAGVYSTDPIPTLSRYRSFLEMEERFSKTCM